MDKIKVGDLVVRKKEFQKDKGWERKTKKLGISYDTPLVVDWVRWGNLQFNPPIGSIEAGWYINKFEKVFLKGKSLKDWL